MDHDLLLDLSHLDDHDPPQFGALRAEEAARRAARHQTSRARLAAIAMLAVVVLVGAGVASIGRARSHDVLKAAQPPLSAPGIGPATSLVPTTVPGALSPATTALGAPQPTLPEPATLPPGGAATDSVPGPAPGPATATTAAPMSAPAGATPTTVPPTRATGQPPGGTVASPAGVRITLTLDSSQVQAGGGLRAVLRFENNRSTAVTLLPNGCGILMAGLYDSGRYTVLAVPSCPPQLPKVVAAGAAEQVEGGLYAEPSLRAGTYDAFATARLQEDGVSIHSERTVVTVVRP